MDYPEVQFISERVEKAIWVPFFFFLFFSLFLSFLPKILGRPEISMRPEILNVPSEN